MITEERIRAQLDNCLAEARFPRWEKHYQQGKVRDMYLLGNGLRLIITTDRQSAFDRVLGAIPFKGQVLNQLANFWFAHTSDIALNHFFSSPHPNIMVVEEVKILPVEIVVRAYLTGSTITSAWVNYREGRDPYDLKLPPGLPKNTRLDKPVITPTTKAHDHDEPLSAAAVVERELVEPDNWEEVQRTALELFARGSEIALEQGLILVDTKYEMGLDKKGRIMVADEIHTPDSSRYWIASTYEERYKRGEEPESLDKEFLRLWLKEHGAAAESVPPLDDEIRVQVAKRYLQLYERVTGRLFPADDPGQGTYDPKAPLKAQIEEVTNDWLEARPPS